MANLPNQIPNDCISGVGSFNRNHRLISYHFWYVQIEWWSDPVIIAITFDTETLFDLRSKSIYSIPTLRLCRAQSRFVCKYTEPFSAILVARRESRWRFSSQMSFWNHCMWFSRTPIHSWPPRNFCVVHVMSCMYTIAIAASNGSLAVCNPDNFHPNQRQNETEPRKKNIVHARGKYIHTHTHKLMLALYKQTHGQVYVILSAPPIHCQSSKNLIRQQVGRDDLFRFAHSHFCCV